MGKKKVPVLLMVLVLTLIMLCACGGTPAASSGDSKSSESKQENSGGTDNDHPYFRKQIQGYENSSFCWQIQENCEIDPGVVAPMESKILERIELGGKEYFVVEKGRWLMEITDDIKDVEYFPHVTELR